MAGDIVERLRYWHSEHDLTTPRPIDLEAADEIERLRVDRDRWKALGQHICEFHSSIIPDHIHQLFDNYNKVVRGD